MAALDAEIREATDGAHSLDDVVQALMRRREVDLDTLREAAEDLIGGPAQSLLIEELE
jgi:predicted metalloprotease with PDZ domain